MKTLSEHEKALLRLIINKELKALEKELKDLARSKNELSKPLLRRAKEFGFSDIQLAEIFSSL